MGAGLPYLFWAWSKFWQPRTHLRKIVQATLVGVGLPGIIWAWLGVQATLHPTLKIVKNMG